MRGHLLRRLQNLRRDAVHHAVQLVQLPELFVDFQFFQDAFLGGSAQLLIKRRVLGGQRLVGCVILFELRPQSLRAGNVLSQQRFQLVQLGLQVSKEALAGVGVGVTAVPTWVQAASCTSS